MDSSLESDASHLRQKLREKDRIIADLEERISNLTRASEQTLQENVKLSKERDGLAKAMRNLRREISKARPLEVQSPGQELTNLRFSTFKEELAEIRRLVGDDVTKGPVAIDFVSRDKSVPKASPGITPRLGYSAAVSPKKTSHATSPTKLPYDGHSSVSVRCSSSQQSSASNSPPRGRPVPGRTRKIIGREFLMKVRSRLSDQQFSAFATIIGELHAQKLTQEEAFRKADEVFGSDNKDLHLRLQGLLYRNVH